MSKSLNHLLADGEQEHQALMEILPRYIPTLTSRMRTLVGIDGVLVPDLKKFLAQRGHNRTAPQIKRALRELGWEWFDTNVPGRTKRVRVWARATGGGTKLEEPARFHGILEAELARWMERYSDPASPDFDPEFKARIEELCLQP